MWKTEDEEQPVGVHDEGVAAVLSAELHHQSELVDLPGVLEQRHQLVLVHVPGNLPHEHLAAPWGGRTLPACITDTRSADSAEAESKILPRGKILLKNTNNLNK